MPPRKSKKDSSRVTSNEPNEEDISQEPALAAAPDDEEEEDEDEDMGIGTSKSSLISTEEPGAIAADLEREKMNLLLANFNEEQMSRYEAFRRANVNRNGVKKLANAILNQSITPNVAVALSGMSKVFVGEVVERAREVQLRMNPPKSFEEYENRGVDPLKPEHLREAWRMMKLESGTVPNAHWRRQGGADGLMFR